MVELCKKLRANDLLHLTSVGLRHDLPLLVTAVQTEFKRRYPRSHRWTLRIFGEDWSLADWSLLECHAPTRWLNRVRAPPNQRDQNDNELLDDSDEEMEDVDDDDTGDEGDSIINVRYRIVRDRQSFLLWTPYDLRRLKWLLNRAIAAGMPGVEVIFCKESPMLLKEGVRDILAELLNEGRLTADRIKIYEVSSHF